MRRLYLHIFIFLLLSSLLAGCISKTSDATSINIKPPSTVEAINGKEENETKNDQKKDVIKQHIEKDINMDGINETIDVTFGKESSSFNIAIISNGNKINYEGYGAYITRELYFSDLDDRDKYVEFYILDEGLSYDPRTYVFRLTSEGIKKVMELDGYLTEYDGKGNFYTEFCKTFDKNKQILARYELDKGVIYSTKSDLQGKILEYNIKLVVHKDTLENTDHNARSIFGSDTDNFKEVKELWGNSIIITEPGEKLKILDIDNNEQKKYGKVRNIAIKVETPDGVQGWIGWLNGGD
jgi:hypothetical protein